MEGQAGDKLPMGGPTLAWSFNRDGEALPGMVEKRDKTMGIDSTQVRRDRADLKPLAKPQSGVDDLRATSGAPRRIFRVSSTARPAQRRDESFLFLQWRTAMTLPYAEDPTRLSAERVRRSTSEECNRQIDRQTDDSIACCSRASPVEIHKRIADLDRERDIERMLEVNASTLALTGLVLGFTVNRKWFVLPGTVLPFLLQHGLQGWCPPLPLLRRMGVRTRGEIDREKHALQDALQGA
jgi:hypothetical protein